LARIGGKKASPHGYRDGNRRVPADMVLTFSRANGQRRFYFENSPSDFLRYPIFTVNLIIKEAISNNCNSGQILIAMNIDSSITNCAK
jgi:hypothetical protein